MQIVHNDEHIKANHAKIFLKSKKVELVGRVQIMTTKVTLGADQANLDYESNTGLLFNGYVQSGSVMFEGDLIEKVGEDEYSVSQANYTTCTNCPSSWSFTGSKIRAELGGYAYIKNSVLKIGSVPVFWLPYLVVPLKSDRQTGLLTPQFEKSDPGGLAVAQPVFFALSRNQDATYTFKNYEFRGPKSMLNYRYMLSEDSYGELDSAWIRDLIFKNQDRVNQFRSADQLNQPINRWFYKYEHYIELPSGVVNRLQLNNASDLQYSSDFPKETKSHAEPALENRVSISKNTEFQHWSVDSSYYINMLQSNPLGGNDSAIHRFPELKWSQTQQNLNDTNFVYSIDLDYLNLTRSGPAYDDLSEFTNTDGTKTKYQTNSCGSIYFDKTNPACKNVYDGKFDKSTDFIRTGQRLDFKPAIYYPMKIDNKIEFVPKLIFRETHYRFQLPEDSDTYRRYARGEISARTTFSRTFGDLKDPMSNRYKHEIYPEITYSRTPWIESSSHPFWGTSDQSEAPFSSQYKISDGDLASPYGLQFDYNDRVYDRYLVTFGVTQKLIEKMWKNGSPLYRQLASLKITQSYDGYQESRNDPNKEPWSSLAAILDVRGDQFETSTSINYFPYQKVTNTKARIRLSNEKGQFFQVQTTKEYSIVPGKEVDSSARTEDYTFRTGFESRHINLMGQFVYDANWINSTRTSRIKSWAYITQFKPPGDCWLITFIHNQTTGSPATFFVNFEFSFDGQPKPPIPPDTLNDLTF